MDQLDNQKREHLALFNKYIESLEDYISWLQTSEIYKKIHTADIKIDQYHRECIKKIQDALCDFEVAIAKEIILTPSFFTRSETNF